MKKWEHLFHKTSKHLANRNGTAPFHSSSSSIWIVSPWHHRMWNSWNKGKRIEDIWMGWIRKGNLLWFVSGKFSRTKTHSLNQFTTTKGYKHFLQFGFLKIDTWKTFLDIQHLQKVCFKYICHFEKHLRKKASFRKRNKIYLARFICTCQ